MFSFQVSSTHTEIFPDNLCYSNYDVIPSVSLDGKEAVCRAGEPGSVSELGRLTGEGNGNPLQYSCLESPMDREAWMDDSPWGRKELEGLSE